MKLLLLSSKLFNAADGFQEAWASGDDHQLSSFAHHEHIVSTTQTIRESTLHSCLGRWIDDINHFGIHAWFSYAELFFELIKTMIQNLQPLDINADLTLGHDSLLAKMAGLFICNNLSLSKKYREIFSNYPEIYIIGNMNNSNTVPEQYRQEIDKIDNEIISLFAKRFQVVEKIGQFKATNNLSVYQAGRWKLVLDAAIKK
jgi:hypothetical protein